MQNNKKLIYLLTILSVILIVGAVVLVQKTDGEAGSDSLYMISHSEYWSGESGSVLGRLMDYRGQPIAASCYANIYYPDNTYFLNSAVMSYNVNSQSYGYNFTVPDIEGVYEYKVVCFYSGKNASVMNSFHVSPALNYLNVIESTLNSGFGNITDNLSAIRQDTDYIRNNLVGSNESSSAFQSQVLSMLGGISNMCGDNQTSGSVLCQWVNETNNRVNAMNQTMTVAFTNVQESISIVYNTTLEYGQNITEIINDFRQEAEQQFSEIQNNISHLEDKLDIILTELNLSTSDLRVTASGTDCIVGMNFVLTAQARNEYNRLLDDTEVYCESLTNFWGGYYNMSYDELDVSFVYIHECTQNGTILWSVNCELV